jgi:hypothetical protein
MTTAIFVRMENRENTIALLAPPAF